MGIVNINEFTDGMILAEDVLNRHGLPLLKKGATLTDEKINVLKTWGVSEADIEGTDMAKLDQDMLDNIPEEVVASIECELNSAFPDFGDNPVMSELYRIARNRKLAQFVTKSDDGA